jgi:hypothetical protein
MLRISPPPNGSTISIRQDGADTIVEIPQEKPGVMAYIQMLLVLLWLAGWGFGFVHAATQVINGHGSGFITVWLTCWTIGGLFVMLSAYRMVRPTIPERLTLRNGSASYDSGIARMKMYGARQSGADAWRSLLLPRRRLELDRIALRSLQLRPTDTSNRLTVDIGTRRIDLAAPASEIEREWLYGVMAQTYAITSLRTERVPA